MDLRVPLGIDTITEKYIGPVEADKERNYLCPRCRQSLIIKGGNNKVIRHFAHTRSSDCSYDKVVHNLAQHILLTSNSLVVNEDKILYTNPRKHIQVKNREVDIILDTEHCDSLIVEIAVTHKLDDAKLEELNTFNILEIDLSKLSAINDIAALEHDVLYNVNNRLLFPAQTTTQSDKNTGLYVVLSIISGLFTLPYFIKRRRS